MCMWMIEKERKDEEGMMAVCCSVLQCVAVCVASSITSVLQCVRKERRVENVLDHHNEVDFNQRETSHTQMMSSRIGF